MNVERRLDGLTSLRFFACLAVVLYHYARDLVAGIPLVNGIVGLGFLGVSFFFVLSGFVLTVAYLPRSEDGAIDKRSFFVARIARIYPVYVLGLALSLPFFLREPHGAGGIVAPIVLRLTLLSAWVPGFALPLNPPSWTLSVEALFYLLFPFALAPFLRLKSWTRWGLVAAALAIGMAVPALVHLINPSEALDSPFKQSYFLPPLHLGAFLLGMETGRIYLQSTCPPKVLSVALGVSLMMLTLVAYFYRAFSVDTLHQHVLAIPFAVVILWVAVNDGHLKILKWPPLVFLGEASYGIYILQTPILLLSLSILNRTGWPPPTQSVKSQIFYLVLLGSLSALSYTFLEVPARRVIRNRAERATVK
jgi:peptidoglycan/LPS O-acetylase OafA/YrhL